MRQGPAEPAVDRRDPAPDTPGAGGPAAVESAHDALRTGARVGPYRLVRVVGSGGAATVWLAEDERLARPVALKFLGGPDAGDQGADRGVPARARARFLVEARAAAALDHPHVARVYDVGETAGGGLYIAMAYYARGSLAERLAAGPLPPAEAARVAAEVADALGAAHAGGVVHRDVKPANVLFDAAGARLADFGVASVPDHRLTATGLVPGTAAYLAPEQVRGERAGPAADLWALGVTLYEMLAGRRPFGGDAPADVLQAVLTADPAPLALAAPDTPPALADLVGRLLAKDPAARPASAGEVARALRAAAGGPTADGQQDDDHSAAGGAPALPPEPLTALVGRGRELAEAARLLDGTRLLTLVGAGGSGKTRLAAALSAAAARGAAGPAAAGRVVWVDLAPVADPGLVPAQIAAALRVPERAERAPLLAVADAVAGARVLLVLDNCEHLVDAAAGAADVLLRRCPALRVLATSREALGVAGETAWLVPPLAPDEARALFAERARAALPGFALTAANTPAVDEICRRLDGIPLAVELAAARVRALAPEQIAERLDDAFRLLTGGSRVALPRQRTLRGTMDWSHALLGGRDRALLRRLAVFAGGFTLEAAEAVCGDAPGAAPNPDAAPGGDPLGGDLVLDGLMSLVDKSLVTMDASGPEPRYRLLETVRQYARERLAEAGERAAYEAAHARHFLAVAEAAAPDLTGGETTPGLVARLTRDNDNFRAAMAWSLGDGDPVAARPEAALRLADALFWYWYGSAGAFGTGQFGPGRAFAEAALAAGAGAPAVLRARALRTVALIDSARGASAAAGAAFDACAAALRGHADPEELAAALAFAGVTRLALGDVDGAARRTDEALALMAPLPPSVAHSFAYAWGGVVAAARGDAAGARALLERNVALGRALAHPTTLAHGLSLLGQLELAEGHTDAAAACYAEAVRMHVALNDPWGLGLDFDGLAEVARRRGRPADAARLLGGVDAMHGRAGTAPFGADAAARPERLAAIRAALGAAFDARYAEGAAMRPDALARLGCV